MPFRHLYIDNLGPYSRSKSGNTTILIILDQLAKFLLLKPLRKASAHTIFAFLGAHMVGLPETLLSDNEVQFVSKEFCALLNSEQICPSDQHRYSCATSECIRKGNRSIIAAIRIYIESDQTNWDTHISSIASSLRNAVHSTTGVFRILPCMVRTWCNTQVRTLFYEISKHFQPATLRWRFHKS